MILWQTREIVYPTQNGIGMYARVGMIATTKTAATGSFAGFGCIAEAGNKYEMIRWEHDFAIPLFFIVKEDW